MSLQSNGRGSSQPGRWDQAERAAMAAFPGRLAQRNAAENLGC